MKIAKYFEGKEVLVTGATGLMGKALVEKILRCCPGVSKIYVIIRSKRGTDPKERWAKTMQSHLFDYLRNNDPQSLSKVVVLPGDGAEDSFGLSEQHQKMLIENVNLVYHGAASINFFNDITVSLKMNLKSTYSMLELAKKMKKLECFTHISTSYCNFTVKGEIKEEVYEQPFDWRTMLELIKDEKSRDVLQMLEPRLLKGHCTTYTLTKAMAEVAVRDYSKHFSTVIVRPVLVTGTAKDPVSGWLDVDNFMTLYGRGVRMGVLRVIPNAPEAVIEMIPLDLTIRGIIVSTWKRSIHTTGETEVYCHRLADDYRLTMADMKNGMKIFGSLAMPNTLWYNFVLLARSDITYGILFLLLHVIPGILLDEALKFSGQKPRLKKVYTNIWRYNGLARYYQKPHHQFLCDNFDKLESYVPEDDKKEFSLDYTDFDKLKNLLDTTLNVMKYSWKENIDDKEVMEKARKRYRMLTVLHYTLCAIGIFILVRAVWPLVRSTVFDRIRFDDPVSVIPVVGSIL